MGRKVTADEYAKEKGISKGFARKQLNKLALHVYTYKRKSWAVGIHGRQQVMVKYHVYEIPDKELPE